MAEDFRMPPTGFGPGSQQTDDSLDYLPMPQDMRTYAPHVPYTDEGPDPEATALLSEIADAARTASETGETRQFDLSGLGKAARALIFEVMGEGEVSFRMRGIPAVAAQESVFAGVWMLKG